MNTKKSKALTSFRSGHNCAQAVLTTFTDDLGVDTNFALNLASGFGGGMGRIQETCGAVTGSFMVIGIYNSQKQKDGDKRKEKTNNMIQAFSEKFKAIHGTTDCKTLINCDLKTDEGQKYLKDNKLSEKVCEKCVQNAVTIIEELLQI